MMTPALRAFAATAMGITAHYAATSAGRARMMAARSMYDAGYARSISDAIRQIRVRRAPGYNLAALVRGTEGPLPDLDSEDVRHCVEEMAFLLEDTP